MNTVTITGTDQSRITLDPSKVAALLKIPLKPASTLIVLTGITIEFPASSQAVHEALGWTPPIVDEPKGPILLGPAPDRKKTN